MAGENSNVRALIGPILSVLNAYRRSEPCDKLATRKIVENRGLLAKKEITEPQASGYLRQLQKMTQVYGGEKCSAIVAAELTSMTARIAKK